MAIITLVELKVYLGDKSSEFTDAELEAIIEEVNTEVQQELNVDIFREPILYISRSRKNNIDGSNTTYYVRNYVDKNFADRNGDGSITITDFKVHVVAPDGPETLATITSFDYATSSIVLSEAYETVRLYISYAYSFFDMDTPDNRIKKLAKYLALSYSYFEIELDLIGTSAKMGNISLSGINTNSKTAKYQRRYESLLKDLKAYGTAKNKPTTFNATKPLNYRPNKTYGYIGYYNVAETGIYDNYNSRYPLYWGQGNGY